MKVEPRQPGRRRFRLWHMVALVLMAALAFGAIRAIADDLGPLSDDAKAALVGALVYVGFWTVVGAVGLGILMGLARLYRAHSGRPLFDWPTVAIRRWGLEQGGAVGFSIWLAAIGLDLVVFLSVVLILAFAAPVVFLGLAG